MKHRLMSSTASNVNFDRENREYSNRNIVYSRHGHCLLHSQTVTQRFFEQASLWPNQIALVKKKKKKIH